MNIVITIFRRDSKDKLSDILNVSSEDVAEPNDTEKDEDENEEEPQLVTGQG